MRCRSEASHGDVMLMMKMLLCLFVFCREEFYYKTTRSMKKFMTSFFTSSCRASVPFLVPSSGDDIVVYVVVAL